MVCDTYLEVPALAEQHGTHTVCTDEMTGMQALERNAPSLPMAYGSCRADRVRVHPAWHLDADRQLRRDHRRVDRPTIGPTRTEADFAGHIERTVATDPEASWVFVVDNLNIHCSETLVRAVAAACGIEEPLGKKEVRGVLKSWPAVRRSCRTQSHRIRFVYTPKHSSWLNQIEVIFGVIMRKVIRRGSFTSVEDLGEKL